MGKKVKTSERTRKANEEHNRSEWLDSFGQRGSIRGGSTIRKKKKTGGQQLGERRQGWKKKSWESAGCNSISREGEGCREILGHHFNPGVSGVDEVNEKAKRPEIEIGRFRSIGGQLSEP